MRRDGVGALAGLTASERGGRVGIEGGRRLHLPLGTRGGRHEREERDAACEWNANGGETVDHGFNDRRGWR